MRSRGGKTGMSLRERLQARTRAIRIRDENDLSKMGMTALLGVRGMPFVMRDRVYRDSGSFDVLKRAGRTSPVHSFLLFRKRA